MGDLYVSGLPNTISNEILFSSFSTVTEIRGNLVVENNLFRTTMGAFRNLRSVFGISYVNNPSLVDARMPSLVSMPSGVSVVGCERLCLARYTVVGASPDDSGCASQDIDEIMVVTGGATLSDLLDLSSILTNVVRNLTSNQA